MVSKREQKRWRKYIEQQALLRDFHLTDLMVKELQFDRKMRGKALRMAKKRKLTYIR